MGQRRFSRSGTRVSSRKLASSRQVPRQTRSAAITESSATGATIWEVAGWAGIFAAILVAYWPVLRGGILWDDNAHITSPALQSLHGLWRIWFELGATQQYYPLLHTAFWLEHRLWGDALIGYHLINLIEHCLSACLVVLIVRKLELSGAWLAGFIFALHPVCVETVAWMSEQKSTLSAVFYLAAALTYLHFDRSRRRSYYFVALGLFLLALMTKSVTATLPAALLVVFWWLRGKLEWRRDLLPLAPWLVIGACSGLFTAWVERTYIGAQGADYELTLAQHILLAGRILCFYAGKILWPVNLIFSYPHWNVDPKIWWQWLYPLAVLVVAVGLVILARKQRGPLASFLFFAGTLFPVLGFMHVFPFQYSYVADHFQYLASLGLIVPGAWLIARGLDAAFPANEAKSGIPVPTRYSFAAGFVLAAVLGVLTWRQSSLFTSSERLYRATIQRNPQSWMAHNNLAKELERTPERLPEAIEEYRAALRIKPDYAVAYYNLGCVLMQMGRLPEAIAEFEAALRIKPDLEAAHSNLGVALSKTPGRLPEAVTEFQAALGIDPNDAEAHMNLGTSYLQMPGRLLDAIREYETTVRLDPDSAQAHANLGIALAQMPDRPEDAIAEFQMALKLDPNNPTRHANLGAALARVPGRYAEAVAQYQMAMQAADPKGHSPNLPSDADPR